MSTFVERVSFVQSLRTVLLFVCLWSGTSGCIIETHGEDAGVGEVRFDFGLSGLFCSDVFLSSICLFQFGSKFDNRLL